MWGFFLLIKYMYRATEHTLDVNAGLPYPFKKKKKSVNHPIESIHTSYMKNRCHSLVNLASLCVQQLQTQTFDHSEILHLKTQKHLTFQIFHSQGYVFRMPGIAFEEFVLQHFGFWLFRNTLKKIISLAQQQQKKMIYGCNQAYHEILFDH